MNVQTPFADFGYQDFALVRAPQNVVVRAAARALAEDEVGDPEATRPPFWLRILLRLTGFGAALDRADALRAAGKPRMPSLTPAHAVFRGDAAAGAPFTRAAPPAHAPGAMPDVFKDGWDDLRISRLAAAEDLVLVEFRELVSGFSGTAFGLSMQMPGTDILYFRRSGDAAAERHHDFHLYRDGEVVRRVLCHATWPHGDPAQEWWEGIADGPATPYEPAGLYDGATEADLLNGRALDVILGHFGLTADALFRPGGRRDPVLFSRRAGGEVLPE